METDEIIQHSLHELMDDALYDIDIHRVYRVHNLGISFREFNHQCFYSLYRIIDSLSHHRLDDTLDDRIKYLGRLIIFDCGVDILSDKCLPVEMNLTDLEGIPIHERSDIGLRVAELISHIANICLELIEYHCHPPSMDNLGAARQSLLPHA